MEGFREINLGTVLAVLYSLLLAYQPRWKWTGAKPCSLALPPGGTFSFLSDHSVLRLTAELCAVPTAVYLL